MNHILRAVSIPSIAAFVGIAVVLTIREGESPTTDDPQRLRSYLHTTEFRFPLSPAQVQFLKLKCEVDWDATTSELMHYWRLAAYEPRLEYSAAPARDDVSSCPVNLEQLAAVFLDDRQFQRAFPNDPPWFSKGTHGLIVRRKQGFNFTSGEAHPEEFLATLAECGIPLTKPIRALGAHHTVRDVLAQAEYDYISGAPAEFSAVAFACYLAPTRGFKNKFGEYITLDSLVDSLASRAIGQGTCYGTHVCYALATLLNVNERVRILSASSKGHAMQYLEYAVKELAAAQHPDGAWRIDWSTGVPCTPPESAVPTWGDAVAVTGHQLEWLAIMPKGRESLESAQVEHAIVYLAETLNDATKSDIQHSYLAWTHAMRAICLWQYCSNES